ncbi:MAG: DUF4388 domain-containing protein [Chromatiales bacterium]|jgi:hypothetical protein
MQDHLTFSHLLDLLSELVDERKSGTLFIRSDSNHIITLGLENGRITALFYGAKRGQNAIPRICQINSGSFRFESDLLSGVHQELPSTPEILNQLRSRDSVESSDPAGIVKPGASNGISREKRDRLCRQLKELLGNYLGPIAQIVLDDAVAESGTFYATPEQAKAFIHKLTLDIDNPGEVEEFRDKALEVFDKVLFD